MLCAPAHTRLLPSFSLLRHPPTLRRLNCLNHRRHHQSPIKMSVQNQIVEHVVLIKVKPDVDSSKISTMINGLNGLTSLNLTVHLTAGKVLRSRSSSLTFTHMLHSRYKSKSDLRDYAVHPERVRVVTENIKPILDDIMAVDWISTGGIEASGSSKAGSAIRVTFLKLKENSGENEKARVLEVIGGIKDQFQTIEELSYERGKGYTIASIAVLPSVGDLELVNLEKEKVKDLIENVVVVDYVIPSLQSASNL